MTIGSLAFFTRLLGGRPAAERYRDAVAEIVEAERLGFSRAWVAQHHLSGDEGGLPSPLPFLGHVAARTTRIRLATGVLTLGLDDALRAAEDASVVDLLSDHRLDLGVGAGGSAGAHETWGVPAEARGDVFERHLARFRSALAGDPLDAAGRTIYPVSPGLSGKIWRATFSIGGGATAAAAGDGLLLSRTQPRPGGEPVRLSDLQVPIAEEYLRRLAPGVAPRILASRTVFVAADGIRARAVAAAGILRARRAFEALGVRFDDLSPEALIAATDAHVGTPDEVAASLAADETLAHATELAIQVHSIDPPHDDVLSSLRLFTDEVAPQLGIPLALDRETS